MYYTEDTMAQFRKDVHAALAGWHKSEATPRNLLDGLLMIKERRAKVSDSQAATLRLLTNELLLEAIEALDDYDQEGARVLSLRFQDDLEIYKVAQTLNFSDDWVSRVQRRAINQLANILWEMEKRARASRAERLREKLPPSSYTHLFGVETAEAVLLPKLLAAETPWVLAIVGLGGIGKTALADHLTRKAVEDLVFEEVAWVRHSNESLSGLDASPSVMFESLVTDLAEKLWPEYVSIPDPTQRLAAVRQALKERPHLIIVDNLESDTDTAFLIAHLNDLSNPSKFLLTARSRPADMAHVYSYAVDELSFADASALIIHHANEVGLVDVTAAAESDLQAIYDLTGGNPLALKLVISLFDTLTLPQVLERLASGHGTGALELYRHIYWQSWRLLSNAARQLLQTMLLVADTGGAADFLISISELSEDEFWPALQELRSRSLLEVRGGLRDKRYGIHRLTATFLQTEIVNWPITETI